jgi:hypothetical protein
VDGSDSDVLKSCARGVLGGRVFVERWPEDFVAVPEDCKEEVTCNWDEDFRDSGESILARRVDAVRNSDEACVVAVSDDEVEVRGRGEEDEDRKDMDWIGFEAEDIGSGYHADGYKSVRPAHGLLFILRLPVSEYKHLKNQSSSENA